MSAGLTLDLSSTVQSDTTIAPLAGVAGTPASGIIVGVGVDMLYANTFCNLMVAGGPSSSGSFKVLVQTSDSDTSGNYTDPTSGLAVMPTVFSSGGVFIVNNSGQFNSGGVDFAGFQRPHRFARGLVMSGDQNNAPVTVAFVSQLKTTGSGGGYSYSPGSGVVSV